MSNLLDVRQVAQRLNLSKWSVYELVRAGRLPAVRLVPGKLLCDPDAVEAAVKAAQASPWPRLAATV